MKLDKNYIELRLAKLRNDPTLNARLIKKWERYLRRANGESN
jgi:hypothetical protein